MVSLGFVVDGVAVPFPVVCGAVDRGFVVDGEAVCGFVVDGAVVFAAVGAGTVVKGPLRRVYRFYHMRQIWARQSFARKIQP